MNPEINEWAKQHRDLKTPAREIAKKSGVPITVIKKNLIDYLGKEQYMKIAHSIGGCAVARKWRTQPKWRNENAMKMSQKVKGRINQLMQNGNFKAAWKEKAKRGSRKGLKRIRQLMDDPEYQTEWKRKCKKGGKMVFGISSGIFSKENAIARRKWSIKGLSRTGRKVIGPGAKKCTTLLRKESQPYYKRFRFHMHMKNDFGPIH